VAGTDTVFVLAIRSQWEPWPIGWPNTAAVHDGHHASCRDKHHRQWWI